MNMDHPQSVGSTFADVPKALPPEHKMAWSVSENHEAQERIVSLGCNMIGRVQGRTLNIHSAALSSLVRNIIKIYPGQNLIGDSLVFQEPYAALMHHMLDLKVANMSMISKEEQHTTEHIQLSNALSTLLDFLRPAYEECYEPAQNRLSQEHPTVMFDDLWVLFKSNSLAYAKVDGQWIGCKIGPVAKLPADPEENIPARWQVGIWYLQTDFSTEEIGCATRTYVFNDSDGQSSITQFDIIPCQLFDKIDGGSRRNAFEKRGQKILDILWGTDREYIHNGRSLSYSRYLRGNVLVAGVHGAFSADKHTWFPKWTEASHILSKDDPVYHALERKIDPKKDSSDFFTETLRIILSPCLNVLVLQGAQLHTASVDNLQPCKYPEFLPEPIIHHNQLHNLVSLVERQGAEGSILRERQDDPVGRSIVVALTGEHGVGKSYTARYVSWRTRRPLIIMSLYQSDHATDMKRFEPFFSEMSTRYNTMILFRYLHDVRSSPPVKGFISALRQLDSMVFLSSNLTLFDATTATGLMLPTIQMTIAFSILDYKRQQKLWLNMMDMYRSRQYKEFGIEFERSASTFLSSADMPRVNWNGHDINKCLQIAISLAQAAGSPDNLQKRRDLVVVDVEHLKQAMNVAFASRSALPPTFGPGARPTPPQHPSVIKHVSGLSTDSEDDSSSDDLKLDFERFHEYDDLSDDDNDDNDDNDESLSLPLKGKKRARLNHNNVRSRGLCIAELNMVEWSTFKTLGTSELFRSKRFYAVDVLVGEPQIWREIPNLLGQKGRISIQGIAPQSLLPETHLKQNTPSLSANAALPERIRINSPAIIKAFSELRIDDSSNLRGSFLLFRPYKVLSYYDKELRDWTEKLEKVAKSHGHPERIDEDLDEGLQADIAEMKCLLSFINTYLKERGKMIKEALVQSVAFDDLWFLFKPGNTVVRNDIRQAYRVVRVATTRHHIQQHQDTSLAFFKNNALAEFDQRHIFVQCVHIDFDGRLLGPVMNMFPISYFKGEKAIASLPIYPVEFSSEPAMTKAFLIERGQAFVKYGNIGHIHYRGLTLPAEESSKLRDEVDSQVVVDFEEAFNRFPQWAPPVKKTVLGEFKEEGSERALSSNTRKVQWNPDFWHTQDTSYWKCIPECCSRETILHDESIDDRTRNDYMAYQANENSTIPSVAIEARSLSDLSEDLKEDDFLIMSYRVFGFVLRSRRWHQLDLADASPTEANSDAFKQLVLPEGHKRLVTSMITKHFRDRQSTSSSRTQTDIVRGKGRGLIMLLHGVPGVGKTSTAECIAGVFNRPLFQITSGDLGITAEDVDENLEENFSLANRWNCILLIDEADVFLAQRSKEDFVQNSLVAVFLRIMEYYSGVLFLTTNRVGVFDEAFSSRIHISLYYPSLDRQQTLEIFKRNWERILARPEDDSRQIDIDLSEITQFAMDYFDNNRQGRWNGRQIRNAFQSALAMAEFEALDTDGVKDDQNDVSSGREAVKTVKLGKKHFEEVAKAYKGFVEYLNKVHGAGSSRRARENMWRFDDDDESAPKRPTALTQRLKFTGDPMQQPPRNVDPSFGPSQHYRGYGPGHENPSNYGPMNPPRGGYAGSHEYHYSPAAFVPRTHEMEQGLYPDQLRAPGPSVNYPPAQPQTYGTRTHLAPPQHEMQTSQSNWADSSRDAQSGVYSYRSGEQNLGAATGPNIRWGGDAEAGSSQQGP